MARPKQNIFPGLDRCLAMLRNRDAMTQEDGYYALLPRVGEYVEPLIAALHSETDPHLQGWLLELLGEARDPLAFPTLIEYFFAPDVSVRQWASSGLAKLKKTSGGQRILWEAHLHGIHLPPTVAQADVRLLQHYLAQLLRDERIED